MREIIPFKKDIYFNTKISDITDISLEHDYKIIDDLVEGKFILEGNYKITEGSLIKEDFFYEIPFTIAITKLIDKDSINLTLKDFSYEIKNSDTLIINVDMFLEASDKEELADVIDEVVREETMDIMNEINLDDEVIEEDIDLKTELIDNKYNEDLEDSLIGSHTINDDEYVTYKVYIAKSEDTLESIAYKYNISVDMLLEYNKKEINKYDKVLIPFIDEK